jgi:hypothetical protein
MLAPSDSRRGVHETAATGVADAGGPLPHLDRIQASFGSHDVTGVRAHTGGAAADATQSLGATAYATGSDVAFRGTPDLHTAAHEAAHVVQQRGGVQLKSGVGRTGDAYERDADAVADTVEAGGSAEGLLTGMTGARASAASTAVQAHAVQFLGTRLDKPMGAGDPIPMWGYQADQRRYSPEQYVAMWEKEQGRKMSGEELETVDRGCIGLTATNLAGGGNPLDYAEGCYATFDKAHALMVQKNKELDAKGQTGGKGRYVMFAKLFWSNQSPDWEERLKPDEDAFLPDPNTGEVDMTGYAYRAQSQKKKDPKTGADLMGGYVNFDYGFWDEASQSFWHANHCKYKDPVKAKESPMKVYQSTKEKFTKGYIDFDRIIFCIARAENYDPGLSAMAHAGRGGR